MARGRVITPDFWTDGNMIGLSAFARLFYIGLWNFAYCDKGHLPDDALGLKLKILPADHVDATALLAEVMGNGRVVRMEAEGKTFLAMPTFASWQKTDPRWKTRCPACALQDSLKLTETPVSLGEPPETPLSSALREEKRTRENQREENQSPPSVGEYFEEAWKHWPKKDDKKDALAKWPRAVAEFGKGEYQLASIVALHGDAYRAHKSKQFTPALVVWLNKARWDNEPPTPDAPASNGRVTPEQRARQTLALATDIDMKGIER